MRSAASSKTRAKLTGGVLLLRLREDRWESELLRVLRRDDLGLELRGVALRAALSAAASPAQLAKLAPHDAHGPNLVRACLALVCR